MNRSGTRLRMSAVRGTAAAGVLALGVLLAGCGPADTGLQRDAARPLQERVLSVSQAAAGNDHAAAKAALETLENDVAAAAADGRLSEDRRRTIMTAVAAVRADLMTAMAAEEAAAAQAAKDAEAAAAAQRQAEAEAAAAAAAAEAAKVAPAPVAPAPAPATGKGNETKGKGKDG